MRAFVAGARLEMRIVRASPDALIPFFTSPLFTIILLTIVRNNGRHDLQPDALMAPVLMTMWWFALFQGGNMLTNDRWQAMLENVLTTPAGLASLTTTAWSNSTTASRTAMVDNLHNAEQVVGQMTAGGLTRMQSLGVLENNVQSQAVMVATNHVFLGISALMTISVAAIWFIPKPKGPVAGVANAH